MELLTRSLPAGVLPSRVAEDARQVLACIGFRILHASDERVEAKGRGLNSTKENPILGAGHVTLRLDGDAVTLSADLAGTRGLSILVLAFPPLLMLSMYAWWRSGLPMSHPPKSGAQVLAQALGWLAVSPLMVLWLRRRTRHALADFLDGLIATRGAVRSP